MPQASPDTIRILVRQTARWATAAQQDNNAYIAFLHASYGQAYVGALRQVANDADIMRVTGVDAAELEAEVSRVQDAVSRKLIAACPAIMPPGNLVKIAKEAFAGLGSCPGRNRFHSRIIR